jgi:hypothetical protein
MLTSIFKLLFSLARVVGTLARPLTYLRSYEQVCDAAESSSLKEHKQAIMLWPVFCGETCVDVQALLNKADV